MVYLNTSHGVRLSSVLPGSPADYAGLRRGDYLVSIDGREIWGADDAIRLLKRRRPGDTVRLTYERHGQIRRTYALLQSQREVF